MAARLVRHGLEALKGCRISYLVGSQILSSGSRLFDSSFIFSHTVPYRRPWNYPLFLSLQPIIGAISAGCPALLKPSEIGPGVSSVLADLFPKYLDQSAYRIINGGVPETTYLLKLKWDHSTHDLWLLVMIILFLCLLSFGQSRTLETELWLASLPEPPLSISRRSHSS